MTIVAFYHGVPPTKDVMASFTMVKLASKGSAVRPLEVYQVGVNTVCFTQFDKRRSDETDEGIEIQRGVQVDRAPLKFSMDGCVKFAYTHGHDQVLLIALENKTAQKTLLRTVPVCRAGRNLPVVFASPGVSKRTGFSRQYSRRVRDADGPSPSVAGAADESWDGQLSALHDGGWLPWLIVSGAAYANGRSYQVVAIVRQKPVRFWFS